MASQTRPFELELAVASAAAREAGSAILEHYQVQSTGIYDKQDGSQVTDADLAADRIIRSHLSKAFPADALLTEEGVDDDARLTAKRCWIVDPIDGTNQFISGTGQFEVLIALVEDHRPVVSVMLQPTTGLLMTASTGNGATIDLEEESSELTFEARQNEGQTRLMTSTWLGAPDNVPYLQNIGDRMGGVPVHISDLGVTVRHFAGDRRPADSLVGIRPGGDSTFAWEWDIAVADLIMHEAGGAMSDLHGNLHRYNKQTPRNLGGIVMSTDPDTHQQVLQALATGSIPY